MNCKQHEILENILDLQGETGKALKEEQKNLEETKCAVQSYQKKLTQTKNDLEAEDQRLACATKEIDSAIQDALKACTEEKKPEPPIELTILNAQPTTSVSTCPVCSSPACSCSPQTMLKFTASTKEPSKSSKSSSKDAAKAKMQAKSDSQMAQVDSDRRNKRPR